MADSKYVHGKLHFYVDTVCSMKKVPRRNYDYIEKFKITNFFRKLVFLKPIKPRRTYALYSMHNTGPAIDISLMDGKCRTLEFNSYAQRDKAWEVIQKMRRQFTRAE